MLLVKNSYAESLEKRDDDDGYDGEGDDKDDDGCHDEVPDTDLEVYDNTKDEDSCSDGEGLGEDIHLVGNRCNDGTRRL